MDEGGDDPTEPSRAARGGGGWNEPHEDDADPNATPAGGGADGRVAAADADDGPVVVALKPELSGHPLGDGATAAGTARRRASWLDEHTPRHWLDSPRHCHLLASRASLDAAQAARTSARTAAAVAAVVQDIRGRAFSFLCAWALLDPIEVRPETSRDRLFFGFS